MTTLKTTAISFYMFLVFSFFSFFYMFLLFQDHEKQSKFQLATLLKEPLKRVSEYYLALQEMMQFTTSKDTDHTELNHQVSNLRELTQQLNNQHLVQSNQSQPERLGRNKRSNTFSHGRT
jgi:hypothetical protein